MYHLAFDYPLIFKVLFIIKIGLNRPTLIKNESKTSWTVISELLTSMMGSGLIECTSERKNEKVLRKQYHVTNKGNQLYESLMLSQGIMEYARAHKTPFNQPTSTL